MTGYLPGPDLPNILTTMRPFHFPMVDVSHHKARSDVCWYSPYFYTSGMGYKMCIGVDANGSGVGEQGQEVVGRCMSVYVHLMPGNYDEHLPWPFRGEVEITLKSKDSGKDGYERVIRFSDKTEDWVGQRVAGCEQSERGWGDPSFIPLDELHKYLENDTVMFVVNVSLK